MTTRIQHQRWAVNTPPLSGALQVGELAVQMVSPYQLWVGVPTTTDPTGRVLLQSADNAGPSVPKVGTASMTGPLSIVNGSANCTLTLGPSGGMFTGDATGFSWGSPSLGNIDYHANTLSVNGNPVYTAANFNPSLYAPLTGATFTGPVALSGTSSNLTVGGSASVFGNLNVSAAIGVGTSTVIAATGTTLASAVQITSWLGVGDYLNVTNAASIGGNLGVSGTTTCAGLSSTAYTCTGNAQVNGTLNVINTLSAANLNLSGSMTVTANGTFGGTLTANGNIVAGDGVIQMVGSGSQPCIVSLQNGTGARWQVIRDTASETGGNVGSNFGIISVDDNGTTTHEPFSIQRQTGAANLVSRGYTVPLAMSSGAAQCLVVGTSTASSNPTWYFGANTAVGSGAFSVLDTSQTERFRVDRFGTLWCTTGTLSSISDARLKSDIRYFDDRPYDGRLPAYGLATVMRLRPAAFTLRENPDNCLFGFIAQDIVEVVPEVVVTGDGDMLGVAPTQLIATLTRAIQELKLLNDELTHRLAALEAFAASRQH